MGRRNCEKVGRDLGKNRWMIASEVKSGTSTKLNVAQSAQKSKIFGILRNQRFLGHQKCFAFFSVPEIQGISEHIKWISICAGLACQLSKKLCQLSLVLCYS